MSQSEPMALSLDLRGSGNMCTATYGLAGLAQVEPHLSVLRTVTGTGLYVAQIVGSIVLLAWREGWVVPRFIAMVILGAYSVSGAGCCSSVYIENPSAKTSSDDQKGLATINRMMAITDTSS
jgi:hypothetical protein